MPIYDKDVQKGVVYYKRDPKLASRRTCRAAKWQACSKNHPELGRYHQAVREEDQSAHDFDQTERVLAMADARLGASGKELQEKWDIKYLGTGKD